MKPTEQATRRVTLAVIAIWASSFSTDAFAGGWNIDRPIVEMIFVAPMIYLPALTVGGFLLADVGHKERPGLGLLVTGYVLGTVSLAYGVYQLGFVDLGQGANPIGAIGVVAGLGNLGLAYLGSTMPGSDSAGAEELNVYVVPIVGGAAAGVAGRF
jgi:hypothetical protein